MEQTMPSEKIFEVRALICNRSNRFDPFTEHLEKEEPIMGSAACLKLAVQVVNGTEHLFRLINELVGGAQPSRIVLLSEGLAIRNEQGGWEVTPLARHVRELFIRNPTHLCGLIALLNEQPHRITDIDVVLKTDDVTPDSLKRKLLEVGTRLWLKSRVGALSTLEQRDAIGVHHVQSEAELKECFGLRHRVYDALGYLEEPVSRSASLIDMDSFDTRSIHFAARHHQSHELVGTARLVTVASPHIARKVVGNRWHVIKNQAGWAKNIAYQALLDGDRVFHEKISQCIQLPFPILFNSDFGTRYREFLNDYPPALGGEVSRVVVSPMYRGLDISALLMRAVISAAFNLGKKFLLLECVPSHAEMYKKYGFELINGHHCRAQDLDQLAVGMLLSLEDYPLNKAVALAKADGRLLGNSEVLCLCRNTECWKRGEFSFRHDETRCPLVEIHRAESFDLRPAAVPKDSTYGECHG
jgi:predicted GNAT family N-acyltransferase